MQKLKPKLIAVDLDGTFLDNKSELSIENSLVAKDLDEAGIILVICSGRIASRYPLSLSQVESIRYVVMSNGASVYDRLSDKFLYRCGLSVAQSYDFINKVKDLPIFFEVYVNGQAYTTTERMKYYKNDFYIPEKARFFDATRVVIDDFAKVLKEENIIEKFLIPGIHGEMVESLLNVFAKLKDFSWTKSSKSTFELNRQNCNKFVGLAALAEHLNISPKDIMAFGDAENDIEMLKAVGYPVAMANASEEIKALCKYQAGQNDPAGVADFIRTYVL